ncbi:MAG: GTP-binding protein [Balneolales bacterium]|nr:GTP-binding protein [Balneolales bacterium]
MPETEPSPATALPVTLITGFLGAGKTSLLNQLLTRSDAGRIAVIQNEFGEISIDHELVLREEDGIFEMQNGCLCCTVRDDLIRVLETLKERRQEFDRIVIETTGMADPVPVAQTFFSSIYIQRDFRLDGIITVTDALHLSRQLAETAEARQQLLCADLILLNKTDLAGEAQQAEAIKLIREINPEAPVLTCTQAEVPIDRLFSISVFHPDRLHGIEASFGDDPEADHTHEHDHEHETHHHHHHTPAVHSEGVSSFSLSVPGEMDLERLDAWLGMLQMLHGGTLYRMKGILTLPGETRNFVFQAVFSVIQGDFGRERKPGDDPLNRFVFIGKNLNKKLLEEGFRACLVQPAAAD